MTSLSTTALRATRRRPGRAPPVVIRVGNSCSGEHGSVEVVIELILELIGQFVFEALSEWVGGRTGRNTRSATTERAVHWAVSIGLVGAGGLGWGVYLGRDGRIATPDAVWIGLALAIFTALIAWRLSLQPTPEAPAPDVAPPARPGWDAPERWWLLAVMSLAAALAVAAGHSISKP